MVKTGQNGINDVWYSPCAVASVRIWLVNHFMITSLTKTLLVLCAEEWDLNNTVLLNIVSHSYFKQLLQGDD